MTRLPSVRPCIDEDGHEWHAQVYCGICSQYDFEGAEMLPAVHDLLAACEAALDKVEHSHNCHAKFGTYERGCTCGAASTNAKLRAAIRKAKGETR